MNTESVIIGAAALCVVWNIVVTLMIYDDLRRRGLRVSFLWLRALAPKYAFQYKEITRAEKGKVGPLFYYWIVSINLALVLVIVAIIIGT